MSDERHWFEKFTLCMEQNIRGVQYGVYSVALIGLAVAVRSVRPFKKFVHPQDIPVSFVEKHISLNGRVVRLQPPVDNTPALLMVDHTPIISLNWLRPRTPGLPVHISSVDISANGLSWLQHIVVGSDIRFTVLKQKPNFASCVVIKERKNVGLELVSLGFASVSALDFILEKDPVYMKYYQQLLAAENRAEKKGSGMWATERSFLSRLWTKLVQRFVAQARHHLKSPRAMLRGNAVHIGS